MRGLCWTRTPIRAGKGPPQSPAAAPAAAPGHCAPPHRSCPSRPHPVRRTIQLTIRPTTLALFTTILTWRLQRIPEHLRERRAVSCDAHPARGRGWGEGGRHLPTNWRDWRTEALAAPRSPTVTRRGACIRDRASPSTASDSDALNSDRTCGGQDTAAPGPPEPCLALPGHRRHAACFAKLSKKRYRPPRFLPSIPAEEKRVHVGVEYAAGRGPRREGGRRVPGRRGGGAPDGATCRRRAPCRPAAQTGRPAGGPPRPAPRTSRRSSSAAPPPPPRPPAVASPQGCPPAVTACRLLPSAGVPRQRGQTFYEAAPLFSCRPRSTWRASGSFT